MSTRAALIATMNAKIISGSRSTTAQNLRDFETDMINSSVNKTDDANVPNGYMAISAGGIADITFLKKATPTGQFIRDDGTWATVLTSSSTLTQVLSSGNTTGTNEIIVSSGGKITFGSGDNYSMFYDSFNGYNIWQNNSTADYIALYDTGGVEIVSGSGVFFTATNIVLNAPNVVLPQETVSRSTWINSSGQLKSSNVYADGNNLFFVSNYGIDTTSTVGTDVLNIGATNANTINYGNSTTIHNFLGTAIYELQVNSYVTDKLMTLNYGGAVSSGIGVGFEIEENSVITGYLKTNAARSGYSFKAPANTTYTDLVFTATSARAITLPDRDLTIDNITTATTSNGTGFIKSNGTSITFDNSTYLTTSSASNGLTSTSTTIKLGGALTATTNITGAFTLSLGTTSARLANFVNYATTAITLFAGASGSPSAYGTLFAYGASNNYTTGFQSTDGTDIVEVVSTPTTYQILLTATNPIIDINNAGATVVNNGTNNVFVVNDAAAKGIIYASDYSANFTPESLVSKRWVGANYQPLATNLTSLTALTYASASFVKMTAAGTFALDTNTYLTTSSASSTYQPLDSDLTTIAGLTATTDNFIVSVSSAWASRTPTQVKSTLSLNNVENTALSTWAGTTNITTLGTIATGVWNGTQINYAYIAAMTSAQLAGIVSDETGTGPLVFANSPTLTTAALGSSTATTQTPSTNNTTVATTAFVMAALLGQNFKEAVKYATIAALPAVVYANGSSGVGATLTGVAFGALGVDSGSPSVNDRILVKNQVSTFQNGWYTVTATGSGIAVFVLTRTLDGNQSYEFETGDSVFVTSGTTLSTTTWAYNGVDTPVIGTDAITFTQTAGQGSFTQGNGITITGVSIAVDLSVVVDLSTTQALINKTYNGLTVTSTTGTLTVSALKTLTVSDTTTLSTSSMTYAGGTVLSFATNKNVTFADAFVTSGAFSLTLTTTASTNVTLPTSGTLYGTKSGSITSAQMLASMSDPTGTGLSVFATSPTFTTQIIAPIIYGSSASGGTLTIDSTSNATKGGITYGTASASNTHYFNAASGANLISFIPRVGNTTQPAMYLSVAAGSETANNYFLAWDGSLRINAQATTSTINFCVGNTGVFAIAPGGSVGTSFFSFVPRARTSLTTLTNIPLFDFGSGNSIQTWAAGTIPLQYFSWFRSQTLAFAAASTATFATMATIDTLTVGTNATIGTAVGLYLKTGALNGGSGTTTGISLFCEAPTSATSNYHAKFTTAGLGVWFDDINIVLSTTTGTKFGTATTQKLSFYNATPVVQPASASQAAVATTAATNVAPYGFAQSQADAIVTLVNQLRSDLVTLGLIKGSA